MATQIAEKSPVAIAGIKAGLNYARDHSVADGLEQIVSHIVHFLLSSFFTS